MTLTKQGMTLNHNLDFLIVKCVVLIVYSKEAEMSMSEGGTQSERGGASHAEQGRECLAEGTACDRQAYQNKLGCGKEQTWLGPPCVG